MSSAVSSEMSTAPVLFRAACAAWSRHAAELAAPIAVLLEHWEENPSADSLVRDGYVHRILPGIFLPPDVLCTAVGRALALGCAIGDRLRSHHVIAGASAAWVFAGGIPPIPATLVSTAHRGDVAGVTISNARLEPDEVETIGGCPITVPGRSAADLLRFARNDEDLYAVARLIHSGHVDERQISTLLRGLDRYPGARTGEAKLRQVMAFLRPHTPALRGSPRIISASSMDTPARPHSGEPAITGLPSAVTR